MEGEEALIAQFCQVTGQQPARAKFYLEATNNDLPSALSMYYDSNKSSINTINRQQLQSSSDESEEENGQDYYAGGEKSGVMLQGHGKDKTKGAADLIKDILGKAKENGPIPFDDEKPTEKPRFTGTGNRLGSSASETSNTVPVPIADTQQSPGELPTATRILTFWRNGFTIDDGELKVYDNPENEEFLKAIKSGRAPISYLNVAFGQKVEVKVAHKMDDDYKALPKPMTAFSGSGNRLGSPTTATTGPTASFPGSFPSSASSPSVPQQDRNIVQPFSVDETLPFTSIQIRLGDGTRMVSRFNHTHTVGDIRNFINFSRPMQSSRNYILMTTFPNKELKDVKESIADAKLLNSVVSQKYL